MSIKIENKILKKITPAIQGVTPGLCLQVYLKGKLKINISIGEAYPYYDWASLTKTVFTVSRLMNHCEKNFLFNEEKLSNLLSGVPKSQVSIKHLLTHQAGFSSHQPFYKKIPKNLNLNLKRNYLRREIFKIDHPHVTSKALYSDIDMMVLGMVLEEIEEKSLYQIWRDYAEQLGFHKTHFHLNNRPVYKREKYAPTSFCPWRKKILQGEVEDENAWALEGVSTHAGLFGPIDELSFWALELRRGWINGEKNRLSSVKVIEQFLKRAMKRNQGDWTLGFMLPALKRASCGHFFSRRSIGHLGFTGTSFWLDPKKDLLITLLTNRVHPTRENINIRFLRPKIHNWIYQLMDEF